MGVTLIGSREASQAIVKRVEETLIRLIVENGETTFYVGNHGAFDLIVTAVFKRVKAQFPHVSCYVVLSHMPTAPQTDELPTILPEAVVASPPKFAISRRNMWMIEHSSIVVTYAPYSFGNSAKYKAIAAKKGKRIIEISDEKLP